MFTMDFPDCYISLKTRSWELQENAHPCFGDFHHIDLKISKRSQAYFYTLIPSLFNVCDTLQLPFIFLFPEAMSSTHSQLFIRTLFHLV